VKPHIKCDNCGENHYVSHCPKRRDETRIKSPAETRRASIGQGGKGYRKKSGGGNGGTRGGSYNQTTFGTGKWKKPAKGEAVRKIDKEIYCAYQQCGWTSGSGAHSTGKHDEYMSNPEGFSLAVTHPYMLELSKSGTKPAQGENPSPSANDEKKPGGSVGLATLANQALALEKDTDDPETSALAGQFAALLAAMSKLLVNE
jgi:hypothetical protein